jgi:hypothetical protein
MIRVTVLAAALFIGAASFSVPAAASTIDWVLSGVTFDDGGTASGTFSTDSSGDVVAFDIATTAGTTLGGAVYDSTASNVFSSNGVYSPHSFIVSNFNTSTYVNFEFADALTSIGTDQLILTVGTNYASYECNMCGTVRGIVSGEATSEISATPLPATIPLFVTGLSAIGLLGRRRKGKAAELAA